MNLRVCTHWLLHSNHGAASAGKAVTNYNSNFSDTFPDKTRKECCAVCMCLCIIDCMHMHSRSCIYYVTKWPLLHGFTSIRLLSASPFPSDWSFSVQGSEAGKSKSDSDLDHSPKRCEHLSVPSAVQKKWDYFLGQ